MTLHDWMLAERGQGGGAIKRGAAWLNTRLLRMSIIVLALGCAGLLLLAQYARSGPTPWSGDVEIAAPFLHNAGRQLQISVLADAPEGTPVELSAFGTVDGWSAPALLANGEVTFLLPRHLSNHAGELILAVTVGGTHAQSTVRVLAGEAVDPIVSWVGPRTIVADTVDETMIVASPVDQWGNPVANGTDLVFSADRPNDTVLDLSSQIDGGVAAMRITAGSQIGRTLISSHVGGATGPLATLDEVAGRPIPFTIAAGGDTAYADGFSLHQVQTEELRDAFGNILPDGVATVFQLDSAAGRSFVDATVQQGRATTRIEAPPLPGTLTVTALVSGVESESLEMAFLPSIRDLSAELVGLGDDRTVEIGPVRSPSTGGYLPDGTLVELRVGSDVIATETLRNGTTSIPVRVAQLGALSSDEVLVEILGVTTPVEMPLETEAAQ